VSEATAVREVSSGSGYLVKMRSDPKTPVATGRKAMNGADGEDYQALPWRLCRSMAESSGRRLSVDCCCDSSNATSVS
jgi:hypothetical protein